MKATLIYNRNAGTSSRCTVQDVQNALQDIGFHPVYKATTCEEDLDPILAEAEGLVVAVGGDGTLRAVATRLVDHPCTCPLSLVPLGTANNVARQLGIEGEPLEIIAGLKSPRKVPFDVGRVRWPWGVDYFLEGAGFGFFANCLERYMPEEGKSVLRGVGTLLGMLVDYPVHPSMMRLDDHEVEGNFLLVEMMNTKSIGPRMTLAPEASSEDGLLEVVRISDESRASFLAYLKGVMAGDLDEHPKVEVTRARRVEMTWDGFPVHLDAEVRRPPQGWEGGPSGVKDIDGKPTLAVELLPQALEFWVP